MQARDYGWQSRRWSRALCIEPSLTALTAFRVSLLAQGYAADAVEGPRGRTIREVLELLSSRVETCKMRFRISVCGRGTTEDPDLVFYLARASGFSPSNCTICCRLLTQAQRGRMKRRRTTTPRSARRSKL